MSSGLSHLLQALALTFVGVPLWFVASLLIHFSGRTIDRWERDGVIGSVRKQDQPGMFAFVVNWNLSISYGLWFVLRGAAIVLWLLAAVYLITAGLTALLGN